MTVCTYMLLLQCVGLWQLPNYGYEEKITK